jgi:hypothetical protein
MRRSFVLLLETFTCGVLLMARKVLVRRSLKYQPRYRALR